MRPMTSEDLKEFYKGDLSPDKRLLIEEFLMDSQPGLMEFFTIKRDHEEPVAFFPQPSSAVKNKLLLQLEQNRPVFINRKRFLATAAIVLVALGTYMATQEKSDDLLAESAPALSIDATSEFVAGGGFL